MEPQCPRWPPPAETLLAEVRLATCMCIQVDVMVEENILSGIFEREQTELNRLCVTSRRRCGRPRKLVTVLKSDG